MNYGRYTNHNQIPKTLIDYFESVAGNKIGDISLEDINDFINMLEDEHGKETGAEKAPCEEAA